MKSYLYFKISGLLILLSISMVAFPQENGNPPSTDSLLSKQLSEVVVTANRFGSVRLKTPEAIRVLDTKKIQRQQLRTSPEALALTPGVFVQKTNHGGGSPFIRGLTGNQTLLLIDGIRLSNSVVRYGPNQYFNTIDVFATEKFEVMRGSGSVQYGSDAIGGTIHAFTPDLWFADEAAWGGTALARVATHGMEQSFHGNVRYSGNNAAFRGGITARNFGNLEGGDTTGRQIPTGYGELDFDVKGKVRLSSKSELTMLFQRVHQSDVPVYHKVVLENYEINRMDPQQRMLGYMRLDQDINAGILESAVFTASFQQSRETRESRKNGASLFRTENDRVKTFSFSGEALLRKGELWTSNTGFEIYNDLVNSDRIDMSLTDQTSVLKRGLYPDGSTMTSIAAYSLHYLDLSNWNFTSGIRYNSYINTVDDSDLGKVTLKPSAIVGNIAVLRKLDHGSSLFISAENGFRAPNIDDLGTLGIVDFRYETPNFSLKPEHSLQYQAGYKLKGKSLSGEFYAYRNELYNLIVRNKVPGDTIEGYPVYRKENVERARIQGVETAWEYQLTSSLIIAANMTYTFGQNMTKNEPVRRIPPLFGRISAEYNSDIWGIGVEWLAAAKQERLAQGDKDDNRIPAGGTPGWKVFNISAECTVNKFTIDLSLVNLLNEDYRYHGSGVNGTGRSAFLTVAVNL
ncbi:MAG TPA: TonB-dependent receptor [Bacteroidales bacterium]|nr:TonB-dependent receptor [Bacteroidales bacterium]